METSAIFAVGMYRRIKAGYILVVSTNPKAKSIGFYSDTLKESISKAIKALKRAINYIVD